MQQDTPVPQSDKDEHKEANVPVPLTPEQLEAQSLVKKPKYWTIAAIALIGVMTKSVRRSKLVKLVKEQKPKSLINRGIVKYYGLYKVIGLINRTPEPQLDAMIGDIFQAATLTKMIDRMARSDGKEENHS